MATLNLLYKQEYAINEHIRIQIPTVGEVLDNEDDYYTMVTMLTAMPVDMMVQLDDIGVDFTAINEYELFLIPSAAGAVTTLRPSSRSRLFW